MSTNLRSDVAAKEAFAAELKRRGYEKVEITSSPSDILAIRDNQVYYFEIKFTSKTHRYFGAATLTEWESAIKNEDHFKFVIARKDKHRWIFEEYTPEQFMEFSYIPPFKIFFNIELGKRQKTRRRNRTAIRLTKEKVLEMLELYNSFRAT